MNQSLPLLIYFAMMLLLAQSIGKAQETPQAPDADKVFNKILILFDSSGSFEKYIPEATEKIQELVDKIASERVKTWEKRDFVELISIDAHPEVIWAGDTKQLKQQLVSVAIPKLFEKRKEYGECTDVEGAFNLAIEKIQTPPIAQANYIFVFSDLIHEPPDTSGRPVPPKHPSPPPEGINWQQLDAKTAISAFWVADEQIRAWKNALSSKHLQCKFAFFNPAESKNAPLVRPEKPVETSTGQVHSPIPAIGSLIGNALRLVGWIFVGLVVVFFLIAVLPLVINRRRSPAQRR